MLKPESVSGFALGKGLVDNGLVMFSDSQVLLFHLFVGHSDRTNIDHKLGIEYVVTLDDPADDTDIGDIESLVLFIVIDNLLQIPFVVTVVFAIVQHKRDGYPHGGDGERFRVKYDTGIYAFGVD